MTKLTQEQKNNAALKWAKERSNGNKEQDDDCFFDFLKGMESAERMIWNN